jgi:two-component system cell cycle response regulator
MKSEIRVFLLGFAPFEKTTFESFFKLAGLRETEYKIQADVAQSHVVIINSDNSAAVQWVTESMKAPQKALFIGAADPSGKWPAVPKPIKLTTILGLLDVLVLAGKSRTGLETTLVDPEPVQKPVQVVQSDSGLSARAVASVRQGTGKVNVSVLGHTSFLGLDNESTFSQAGQGLDHILIVDADDSALKFMQKRIERYGFLAELTKTGKEALVRISTGKYKFVFLEVVLPDMDGYQVCRDIKQDTYPSGKPPVVVMFSSRGTNTDKIRGGLAGCDAYLTKPLIEAELLKVLSKYDEQIERSFRRTNVGISGLSTL